VSVRIEIDADAHGAAGHSSPDRRVPVIRQGTGPGGWVIVGKQDSCPLAPSTSDLHPHLWVRPQVADVISLRAVCGHHPEGVIYQAVPDWGVPVAAGAAAGGFQQRESPRCKTMQQQESPQSVAGPLDGGDHPVLAGPHSLVLPAHGRWSCLDAAATGFSACSGEGNRILMTSLEGVWRTAIRAAELEF
jgi:hypothetical protein